MSKCLKGLKVERGVRSLRIRIHDRIHDRILDRIHDRLLYKIHDRIHEIINDVDVMMSMS